MYNVFGTAKHMAIRGVGEGARIVLHDVTVGDEKIDDFAEFMTMLQDRRIGFYADGSYTNITFGDNAAGLRNISFNNTGFSVSSIAALNPSEWGFV